MSEYMEKHSISKLIGAPPGYKGYEEEGLLVKKVKSNPYSIVLFDEVEKAHPEIMNILLQVLEEGELSSSQNKTIDFKNTIIIMTSNIGASKITNKNSLGFHDGAQTAEEKNIEVQKNVLSQLKKEFSPELLNRIEDVIVFNKLEKEELEEIAKLLLVEIEERLKSKNICINLNNDGVIEYILKHEMDKEYGARELKRIIKNYIEDVIVEFVLEEAIEQEEVYRVEIREEKIHLCK